MGIDQDLSAFADGMRHDLGRLLVVASAAVNARIFEELDPLGESGVRLAHAPLLAALDADGTRMVDLAARTGVTRQAVAALARDLERAGVVTIEQDPEDARAVRVHLTESGAALCRAATVYMESRERAWRSTMGDDAIDNLRATLGALAKEQ